MGESTRSTHITAKSDPETQSKVVSEVDSPAYVRMPFVMPKEITIVILSSLWPVSLTPSGGGIVSAEGSSSYSSWSFLRLRTVEGWHSALLRWHLLSVGHLPCSLGWTRSPT